MSTAAQPLTVEQKVSQQAARHNLKLNVPAFIEDWNSGVDERETMKKYSLSGQQMADLVVRGGLKPRFLANDSREKDAEAKPSSSDVAEAVVAAHQRIDSLSGSHATLASTVATQGSTVASLAARVSALEAGKATS